jgi:hypothetical protein
MNFNILKHLIKKIKIGSLFVANLNIDLILVVLLLNCFYINKIECQQYSSMIVNYIEFINCF